MWSVVTGASGFIGQHLVWGLASRGIPVRAVDQKPFPNTQAFMESCGDRVEFLQGDLVDRQVCQAAVDGARVVYHLAAETDLRKSFAAPALALSDDLITTVRLLEACREESTRPHFVLASSAAVYGNVMVRVADEIDAYRMTPLSPYGAHKKACESYVDMYRLVHDMSTCTLRFFNVYGPGQLNLQAVVPSFTRALLRDKVVHINGDGLQSRDFVYVGDVVRALLHFGHQRLNGVFNIGSGDSYTLLELLVILEGMTGKRAETTFTQTSKWDIRNSRANIGRSRDAGWSPEVSLEEGLEAAVEYYAEKVF